MGDMFAIFHIYIREGFPYIFINVYIEITNNVVAAVFEDPSHFKVNLGRHFFNRVELIRLKRSHVYPQH